MHKFPEYASLCNRLHIVKKVRDVTCGHDQKKMRHPDQPRLLALLIITSEKNGGTYGARTRNLYRDRVAL